MVMEKKVMGRGLSMLLMMLFIVQGVLGGMVFTVSAYSNSVITYLEENFEGTGTGGVTGWVLDKSLKDADYTTKPTAYSYTFSNSSYSDMKVIDVSGNKVLKITQVHESSGSNKAIFANKTAMALPEVFNVEARLSYSNDSGGRWNTSQKSINVQGKAGANSQSFAGPNVITSAQLIDRSYNFPSGTDVTLPAPNYTSGVATGMSAWYDIKMVFRKDANGKYIYDLYTKKDSSVTDWVFAQTIQPLATANLMDSISTIQLQVQNGSAGIGDANMYVDNFKVYAPTFGVTSSSIANGATVLASTNNMSIGTEYNINPSTVTTSNVIMKRNGTVLSGYTVALDPSDSRKINVGFSSGLEADMPYTIELTDSITNSSNTRSLTPYTLAFTATGTNNILNEDFEGSQWVVDRLLNDSSYTSLLSGYTTVQPANMKVVSYDSKKALQLASVAGGATTEFRRNVSISSDKFYVEAKLSYNKASNRENRTAFTGNGGGFQGPISTSNMKIWGGNTGYNWTDTTAVTGTYTLTNQYTYTGANAMSDWYYIKMVFNKNKSGYLNGKYTYDLYIKKNDASNWVFEKTVQPLTTASLPSTMTQVGFQSYTATGSSPADVTYLDYFKIYEIMEPSVYTSTITNGQTGVDENTTSVDITFNQAMNASTINNTKITLQDVAAGTNVSTTGSYNATDRKYTMTIPAGALFPGKTYKIMFASAITNDLGNSIKANSDISFTIKIPDLEVQGSVEVTDTNGGATFTNLTGKTSAYAKVTLKKNVASAKTAMIAVALYDTNQTLRSVTFQNKTLSGAIDSTESFNDVGLTGISPLSGWKVKVFVWDGITSMKPIAKQIGLVQAN